MTGSAAREHAPHTTGPGSKRGLIVDLFAGGGGASVGIHMATGFHPDVAVNHDRKAVGQHEINHPGTRHYCCDVFEVDPVEACSDTHGNLQPVALLWASPDCTHHSKARGGKPAEKKIRALAWVVVKWASKVKPRCIFLENVEEFQDWGPLDEENRPDKTRKGDIFRLWVSQLEALGYQVAWRELVAADFGAPTTRKRLSLIARSDGQPLQWPTPTHAARHKLKNPSLFDAPMVPWRSAAADVIDWAIPCPSIFGRKKALAPKTRARIAKGIRKFVIEAAKPFIVPLTHVGDRPNHDISDPLKTVTSANRGELGLVTGTLVPRYGEREGQEPRAISVDGPYPTVVPNGNGGDVATALLVGSSYGDDRPGAGLRAWSVDDATRTITSSGSGGFGLAAIHVTKFSENSTGTHPEDPLDTVMAGAPRHGVVAAHITKFRQGSSGASIEEPFPTITANSFVKRPGCGIPLGHVEAAMSPFVGRQFGKSVGSDAESPVGTITAGGGGKTQLVAAHLGRQFGTAVGRDLEEPHPTVMTDGAGGKSYVSAACLTSYYGTGDGSDIAAPLPTVVTKDRHAPAVAFMEQANTGVVGHAATDPVSTILAAGCHQRPVECEIEPEGYDTSRRGQVLAFLREHFGEPTAEEIANPAGSLMARVRHGLVLIGEAVWQIADIGMRMLTPRELYNAQGFPRDYIIDRTADGPLTKTAQTRMAGNSVSPPWAAAIIAANDPLGQRERRAAA